MAVSEVLQRVFHYVRNGRLDYLMYAVWVRWRGLDFGPVSLKELGFSYDNSEHHSASGGVFLRDALRQLEIPPGSRAIDLGCGKGSAVCTLAGFPFEEVAGVELSPDLARIAEQNARKLAIDNAPFYVSDAADFQDLDRFTHIYMFNPFPASVMEAVMRNLAASLARAQRTITLIYFFPVCHDTIWSSGLFQRTVEVDVKFTHPYRVYVHQKPGVGHSVDGRC
jgi:predicted RNA methylase